LINSPKRKFVFAKNNSSKFQICKPQWKIIFEAKSLLPPLIWIAVEIVKDGVSVVWGLLSEINLVPATDASVFFAVIVPSDFNSLVEMEAVPSLPAAVLVS